MSKNIETFEVYVADEKFKTRSFPVGGEDGHSEDLAWQAAADYAQELVFEGYPPEEVTIVGFSDTAPVEIRNHFEFM
ncbi:MAG: hypothetical protein ACYCY8_04805 [Burkholderiales bacterium]